MTDMRSMNNVDVVSNNNNPDLDSFKIRKFFKLHNAMVQLQDSINCIYENAFTDDEILDLQSANRKSQNLNQSILNSPTVSMANYLLDLRDDLDFNELFRTSNFQPNDSPVHKFIKYPVITDSNLEKLAFIHKSFPNMSVKLTETEKIIMSNERLEFLGDSWLGALVSYIIYTKYPYANEGSLSKMKSAIVNNNNLEKLCTKLGFKDRLKENVPRFSLKIKDKFSKYYADCVEAYIGALVIDRFSTEFKEVAEWLEELSQEHFIELGPEMLKKPLNKNAKGELAELLQFNNIGGKIHYRRLNNDSPFTVEVLIGDNILAQGVGQNVREAEQRAAMEVLADEELIQKYCSYEIEKNYTEEGYVIEDVNDDFINQKETAILAKHHQQEDDSKLEDELYQSTSRPLSNKNTKNVTELEEDDHDDDDVDVDDVDKITQQVMAKMSTMITSIVTDTINKKNESRRASRMTSRRTSRKNSIAVKSQQKKLANYELQFNDNASDIAPHDVIDQRNSLKKVSTNNQKDSNKVDRGFKSYNDEITVNENKNNFNANNTRRREISLNKVNGISMLSASTVDTKENFDKAETTKENIVKSNIYAYNVKSEPFKPTRLLQSKGRNLQNLQNYNSRKPSNAREPISPPLKVDRSELKKFNPIESSSSSNNSALREESYSSNDTSRDTIKVPKYFRNGSISFISSDIAKTPTHQAIKPNKVYSTGNESSSLSASRNASARGSNNSSRAGMLCNINDNDDFDENNYDKNASGELYALLGSVNLFPSYEIREIGVAKFHSICSIQGVGTHLGEGIGRNKKMAQHISANYALYSKQLQSILGDD